MRREITLLGTWNSAYNVAGNDDDWQTALAALAARTIDLAPLITHRVPLENAFDALGMMKEQREFFSKVLIAPQAEGV